MRISHRLRLAAVSAGASGLVLALLFTAIVVVAREMSFAQRREELITAVNGFTLDTQQKFDAHEFEEAHPEMSCAIFRDGEMEPRGLWRLRPIVGFEKSENHLLYGKRFRGETIVAASDWSETKWGVRRLGLVLGGLWLPLTLVIGAATWVAAGSVFRPLKRLTAQASTVAESHLSTRLDTDDRAEFGEFSIALNGMLDRIEEEVNRGDRFAADAAHELRTPLAILRTRIETALLRPRSSEEYVETLRRALREITRLTDLAQSLLRTARGEVAEVSAIDLEPVVREGVESCRERFVQNGRRIELKSESVKAAISAEELRIVLDNLLDNALRFAPKDSVVQVVLGRAGDRVELSVHDSGPGFAPELGDRAFDRLVRGDDSRNRSSGGAGIGLSVCRRIAMSRGGKAFLRESVGGGATVVLSLPRGEISERNLNPV